MILYAHICVSPFLAFSLHLSGQDHIDQYGIVRQQARRPQSPSPRPKVAVSTSSTEASGAEPETWGQVGQRSKVKRSQKPREIAVLKCDQHGRSSVEGPQWRPTLGETSSERPKRSPLWNAAPSVIGTGTPSLARLGKATSPWVPSASPFTPSTSKDEAA